MSDVIPPPPPEFPPDQEAPAPTPPAPPSTRSPLVIMGVVVLVVALLGGVAFFALRPKGDDGTYTANGVTFQYPSSWINGDSMFGAERGTSVWSQWFGPTDGASSVIVSEYALTTDISAFPVEEAKRQVTVLIQGLVQDAGGAVTSDVTATSVGTLDGYVVTLRSQMDGTPVDVELTMMFHGKAQYNINCQYSAAMQAEVAQGCEQVKSTFALTGESPAP